MGRYAEDSAVQHVTTHSAAIALKLDPGPSRWPEKISIRFKLMIHPIPGAIGQGVKIPVILNRVVCTQRRKGTLRP